MKMKISSRALFKINIKEEIEKNKRRSNTLDFLDEPIPKNETGQHIPLNIVQIARQNFQKKENRKLKKSLNSNNKKLSSDLKNLNLNNNFSRSRNQNRQKTNLTYRTVEKKKKKYDEFVNNIIYKMTQKKQEYIIEVNKIRKEIPNDNQHYFHTIINENKFEKPKQKLLSHTYEALKQFKFLNNLNLKKNVFPPIKKVKVKLNSERKKNNLIGIKNYASSNNLHQNNLNSLSHNNLIIHSNRKKVLSCGHLKY